MRIGECQNAIAWATGTVTKTHARHIHADRLRELGVKVAALEDDLKHTLTLTPAVKIIENQNSVSFIIAAQIFQPRPPQ